MKTKISHEFWSDRDIENLDAHQKLAALWVLTNSRIKLFGYTEISKRRFEFETGSPWEALSSLCEALPKTFALLDGGVWVRNFIRHQFGTGFKLVKNNFCRALEEELRGCQGLPVFALVLSEYPELMPAFETLQAEGLAKGLPSPREEKSRTEQSREEKRTLDPAQTSDDILLIRAKGLFTRRAPQLPLRLDSSQISAWKKNKAAVGATLEEEWELLAQAYGQTSGDAAKFRRKDLAQLLNNWCAEITRAATWRKDAGAGWLRGAGPVVPVTGPEGWQAALQELYPDCERLVEWNSVSADVKNSVNEILKKNKGGQKNDG